MSNTANYTAVISSAIEACRGALLDAAESMGRRPGSVLHIPRADLDQMVVGFFGVLRERLEGRGDDLRTQFIATIYPSLVDAGEDPVRLLRLSTEFHVLAACMIIRHTPPESQEAAATWLADFLGSYSTDIAQTLLGTRHE